MTRKPNMPEDPLSRLSDELADDVMSTSEEEILSETRSKGADPAAAANRVRGVIQRAVILSGKERMQAARAQLRTQKTRAGGRMPIDIARARKLLQAAAAKDPELRQRLTLAARNGETLPDSDVQSLVEDLLDLGILPNGNEGQ